MEVRPSINLTALPVQQARQVVNHYEDRLQDLKNPIQTPVVAIEPKPAATPDVAEIVVTNILHQKAIAAYNKTLSTQNPILPSIVVVV